jgi:hypothetical protein
VVAALPSEPGQLLSHKAASCLWVTFDSDTIQSFFPGIPRDSLFPFVSHPDVPKGVLLMSSFSFQECYRLFAIDPKTLRQWLVQAQMSLHTHPKDARIKCLSDEQVQLLARLHGLTLSPDLSQVPSSELVMTPDTHVKDRLAHLEAMVATLQAQLTDLTLQLLREREQHTEQRLLALETERACADPPPVSFAGASPAVPRQPVLPALVCHPTEKRHQLIPLIEYAASGRYVLISPEVGELSITPDSPEWFTWLASLSSFRFVGRDGRFSARRGYNRGPNRCWYAQRGIHQKNYSKYIGVSEHITTARLEQIAAHFQSYLTLR